MKVRLARLLPLAVLLVALGLALAFDLHHYVSLDSLRQHREDLAALVDRHPAGAALAFAAAYAGWVTLSIPGAFVLTIVAGFLFGTLQGTVIVAAAGTAGATAVFLVVRYALADLLRAFAGRWLERLRSGFARNGFFYLLTLRVLPIFPFFVVNIVPAFLGVRAGTFVAATALGIVPGCFIYASVGAGLGAILDRGEEIDAATVLTPDVIFALCALAALALLPVILRHLRRR